ncbi:MAG: calcium/sodium antiporter [Desulfovibrionaceae bacterium]|jgi:cation:H+ antiporter|nr:calcium/sodium antiporter [Desulfovibrionaceae bacterium]
MEIVYLLFGGVLLWFGSDWIVESASAIARTFRVSELVIGLTIVAMGTSAPEFLVTLLAALKGLADISLANVVGSNVFNLGIILGFIACITPITAHASIVRRDVPLLFGVCLFLVVASLDLRLDRLEGAILAGVFISYLGWLLFQARRQRDVRDAVCAEGRTPEGAPCPDTAAGAQADGTQRPAAWWDYPRLALGFGALALGSDLLVDGASAIAGAFGVSDWAIGLTIVAAGTSLPELFTAVAAAHKGKNDMLLGNLVGSDLFNLTGVLGLTCLLRPLRVAPSTLPGMYAMAAFLAVVMVCVLTRRRISRLEGALFVLMGLARWAMALL